MAEELDDGGALILKEHLFLLHTTALSIFHTPNQTGLLYITEQNDEVVEVTL